MEIRQLEYFHEIAATGSINEAARRLNMSQPPLSYQIKQLEAELKREKYRGRYWKMLRGTVAVLVVVAATAVLTFA